MEFADLYGKDKNGKTKIWKARVYENALAEIQHGQLNGAMQTTTREYTVGKNIGRKNETTAFQQAVAETKRKWQDKQEKEGYTTTPDSSNPSNQPSNHKSENLRKIFPMLAHTFDPTTLDPNTTNAKRSKKNGIVFPCYVQPKLDGLRCICVMDANGKIWLQSRTGSYFENLGHLYAELTEIFQKYPGIVLDGELYTTDMPFEELAGLIKKKKLDPEGNDKARLTKVKYHLYDCILLSDQSHNSFEFRWRELRRLVSPDYTELKFVETEWCNDLETFRDFFSAFVQEGFEGIMLRNQGGQYRENYRSHDLQKYKEFVENEYEITGFTEGDGRDKGAIIWICKIPVSNTIFNVRPKGTMEYRRVLYMDASQHPAKYIGKMLTVIYQELSEYGVPRFPVGKAVREDY